jgi:hypothetical protein
MPGVLLAIQIIIMNWYIAKIVFNISSENTKHTPQFDEQLRLISADHQEEAFHKARVIGLSEEDSFFNDQNNRVKWEFINVSEVVAVNRLEDGAELYSQILETNEAKSYINCVHQKAIFLRRDSKVPC